MCGDHGTPCTWGRAVSMSNRYIYASQPNLDRILIVSTAQMAVVDVVGTDKVPVELSKVLHLDQLWLLSWREGNNTGAKTVQVLTCIRFATVLVLYIQIVFRLYEMLLRNGSTIQCIRNL